MASEAELVLMEHEKLHLARLVLRLEERIAELEAALELVRKRIEEMPNPHAEKRGKANSPWHTDYAALARKTALRALLNRDNQSKVWLDEIDSVLGKEEAGDGE